MHKRRGKLLTTRTQAESLEHLEVVSVTPLAGGAITIICVVLRRHLVAGCPVEIGQADYLFQRRQSAIGTGAKDIVNAGQVSLNELAVECSTHPVSGSFRKGLAASATDARARTEKRIVKD